MVLIHVRLYMLFWTPFILPLVNLKKLQGIRNDRKRKEIRGDTDGTIILFLYPLIFDTKIPRDKEQSYRPVCVSSCFFSFSVVPNPL